MEISSNYRHHRHNNHRRTPSSDRFLNLFSPPIHSPLSSTPADENSELTESDILWTTSNSLDSSESTHSTRRKLGLRQSSGILAALSDDNDAVLRPPSTTTPFRSIPKPHRVTADESTQPRKFQNSAPIRIPAPIAKPRKTDDVSSDDVSDDDDEEMLPPHEIVAMKIKKTSSSVLEGVGRTLKGRDLRQVRNAVWRQTGFLD